MEYNDIDPRDSEAIATAQAEAHRAAIVKQEYVTALHKLLLSPEGEKLVEYWEKTYVMGQIAMPDDTNIAIGIKQGQALFVLNIRHTMEQLKKGVENG